MATELYSAPNTAPAPLAGGFDVVPIDLVAPFGNPRRTFDQADLEELAASIAEYGILEPLVVRDATGEPPPGYAVRPRYYIIAGERRWRAAKLAGLERVPVVFRGAVPDEQALKLALLENLQRKDLDPLEEAESYRTLNERFGLTQSAIAAAVKRSQPVIANRIRLLDLPDDVRELIRKGELSPSHGVALARWADFPRIASILAKHAVKKRWTTKEVDREDAFTGWQVLDEGGSVRLIDQDLDLSICRSCPFGAYRTAGHYGAYCLKPEHAAELKAAHRADTLARAKANAPILKAELDAEVAAERATGLPRLAEMSYSSYEDLRNGRVPPGCDESCPCRGKAIDHGGRETNVCLDPKRLAKLKTAEEKAKTKARKVEATQLAAKVWDRLDRLTEVGPAELVILAHAAVKSDYGVPRRGSYWQEARQRWGIGVGHDWHLDSMTAIARQHGALVAVKCSLAALLQDEIRRYHDGSGGDAQQATLYLNLVEHPEKLVARETEGGE